MSKIEITAPSVRAVAGRIREHLGHATSQQERREIAMTWSGYVGSLLEWGAIEVRDHDELRDLIDDDLPEDAPIQRVFLGFDDDEEDTAHVAAR